MRKVQRSARMRTKHALTYSIVTSIYVEGPLFFFCPGPEKLRAGPGPNQAQTTGHSPFGPPSRPSSATALWAHDPIHGGGNADAGKP
jgi:hypothetical protein